MVTSRKIYSLSLFFCEAGAAGHTTKGAELVCSVAELGLVLVVVLVTLSQFKLDSVHHYLQGQSRSGPFLSEMLGPKHWQTLVLIFRSQLPAFLHVWSFLCSLFLWLSASKEISFYLAPVPLAVQAVKSQSILQGLLSALPCFPGLWKAAEVELVKTQLPLRYFFLLSCHPWPLRDFGLQSAKAWRNWEGSLPTLQPWECCCPQGSQRSASGASPWLSSPTLGLQQVLPCRRKGLCASWWGRKQGQCLTSSFLPAALRSLKACGEQVGGVNLLCGRSSLGF